MGNSINARGIHCRIITGLIGIALLLGAYNCFVLPIAQAGLSVAGLFWVCGGAFGSIKGFLPCERWAVRLDRLIFALSDMAGTLDELASRKRLF